MVSSTIALALAIAIPTTFAQSSNSVSPCLNQCIKQTTQPCTTSSLGLLISCINTNCATDSSNSSTSATVAASLALTYTPKIQYSCQQSFVPGSTPDATSLQLTGDGTCQTSPYDFQSLFISADSTAADDDVMTLSKLARQCTMMLYPNEACEGQETELDLGDVQGDKCIFQGGRSAKLMCTALRAPDTPSYASILSSLCSGGGSGPNGTAPAPATNSTNNPFSGGGTANATSSTEPTSPSASVSVQPQTGRASGDQVAKPSLIALVALFAVAVLLL